MFIFLIVAVVLAYFALPEIMKHRERMAEIKKNRDKDNQ